MNSLLNVFDGVLYINLAIREDRRRSIERELRRVGLDFSKVFRIEGVHDELNGSRGCVCSHVQALDFALERGWKNVLVLEDDCLFVKPQDEINTYIDGFLAHFKKEWDVFFLGTQVEWSEKTSHDKYCQVHFSLRSHAYAVNGPYLETLRNHFAATHESMSGDLFYIQSLQKALDRQWVTLQLKDRWFAGVHPIAKQSQSFSDIEKVTKTQR